MYLHEMWMSQVKQSNVQIESSYTGNKNARFCWLRRLVSERVEQTNIKGIGKEPTDCEESPTKRSKHLPDNESTKRSSVSSKAFEDNQVFFHVFVKISHSEIIHNPELSN